MVMLSELDLPHLTLNDPDFAADPLKGLKEARAHHPWLATSDMGVVINEFHAMRDLLLMEEKFDGALDAITEIMGAKGTRWGNFMNNLMLAKDPPEHTRLRASVAPAFTPKNANRLRGLMRENVSALLDQWVPKGGFDFAEFASYFPISVMFGLIGADMSELPAIMKSLETQGLSASADARMLPALEDAYDVLWDFVDRLVLAREGGLTSSDDDLLNQLLVAKAAGNLDDTELRNMLIFLFAAGYDTSKNMLTLIMRVMLDRPEMWQRCAADHGFCDKVVEEVFRFHSVSNTYRTAKEDFVYRDVTIPKGTVLIMTMTFAARDPGAFSDPDTFNPERVETNRHIAFGRGIHMCLGQHTARAQIQEGIHLIAQRLLDPKLAGEITYRPFPGVWGLRTLPISFTPGARRPAEQDAPIAAAA